MKTAAACDLRSARAHRRFGVSEELRDRLYVEAHYAVMIQSGETIWTGDGRKLRVVDVVPVEEEESPYVGLLRVQHVR